MKSKKFHRNRQLQILNQKRQRRPNPKIPLDHFAIDQHQHYLVDINYYQPKSYNYAFFNLNNQKVYRFDICSDNIDAYNSSKNLIYLGQGYPLYSYQDIHNAKNKSFDNMKVKHFWANPTLIDNYQLIKNYNYNYNLFKDYKLDYKLIDKYQLFKTFFNDNLDKIYDKLNIKAK